MSNNYPLEIFLCQKKQTFYVNSHLVPVTEEDAPLLMYRSPEALSRYELVIINEQNKATTANIPVTEILRLQRLSNVLYERHVNALFDTKKQPVIISSGVLKGKTPEQVLLENGMDKGKELLRNQYLFLKKNLPNYPANQAQMDAITEAVKNGEKGQLSEVQSHSYTLYETNMRPLKSKVVPQGLGANYQFVYEIKIDWVFGSNVEIIIQNYYAPVETLNDGRLNVKKSMLDKNTFIKNKFSLSGEEWMNFMYNTTMDMNRFEMMNAKYTYQLSQKLNQENRKQGDAK